MKLIFEDQNKRLIKEKEDISFTVEVGGLYLIYLSARARGEKQLGSSDDEDLRVEIDGEKFPKLTDQERYLDSPAAFSGGQLHNLKKTVYFLLKLDRGEHTISLVSDISATFESLGVFQTDLATLPGETEFSPNIQAEDGDRYPWVVFAFANLAVSSLSVTLTLKRRFLDSDDVKVIIDGNTQKNFRNGLHKLWYFVASFFTGETQTATFIPNLPIGLHYIEFWADRMPVFEKITFLGLYSASETTIEDKIKRKAKEFGLDSELIVRLAKVESNLDPKATSPVGAKGIFQLMDITIKQIANLGYEIADPYDPDQNITGGIIYFKWLYEMYDGDKERLEKTLAAWNWGLRHIPKDGPLNWQKLPVETKTFIKNVMSGRK